MTDTSGGVNIISVRMNSTYDRTLGAVVFDVGGVLLDWDPRHLYRKLIPDPLEMEWFLDNVCTAQWHDPHDRGQARSILVRPWRGAGRTMPD